MSPPRRRDPPKGVEPLTRGLTARPKPSKRQSGNHRPRHRRRNPSRRQLRRPHPHRRHRRRPSRHRRPDPSRWPNSRRTRSPTRWQVRRPHPRGRRRRRRSPTRWWRRIPLRRRKRRLNPQRRPGVGGVRGRCFCGAGAGVGGGVHDGEEVFELFGGREDLDVVQAVAPAADEGALELAQQFLGGFGAVLVDRVGPAAGDPGQEVGVVLRRPCTSGRAPSGPGPPRHRRA